ncbi:MAG TPA: hypothetical protein VFE62_06750, partial [Gemmataceae bacterium]|nr:hypothetical protein [Gemmataceae bacterium]
PVANNVPIAQPVPGNGDYAAADTLEMANTPLAEPAPIAQPEFLGMSATGRETTTNKPTPRPTPPAATSRKLPMIIGGAAFVLVALPCIACLLMYLFTPAKKKGSIEITKTQYANANNVLKPGYNFIHVYIKRIDFAGPVTISFKDLPAGVEVQPKTIPANNDRGEVRVTVSHGTPTQTKQVRLVAEHELEKGDKIVAEIPFALNVIDDPNKLKKR